MAIWWSVDHILTMSSSQRSLCSSLHIRALLLVLVSLCTNARRQSTNARQTVSGISDVTLTSTGCAHVAEVLQAYHSTSFLVEGAIPAHRVHGMIPASVKCRKQWLENLRQAAKVTVVTCNSDTLMYKYAEGEVPLLLQFVKQIAGGIEKNGPTIHVHVETCYRCMYVLVSKWYIWWACVCRHAHGDVLQRADRLAEDRVLQRGHGGGVQTAGEQGPAQCPPLHQHPLGHHPPHQCSFLPRYVLPIILHFCKLFSLLVL